jgi:hypothetical protein
MGESVSGILGLKKQPASALEMALIIQKGLQAAMFRLFLGGCLSSNPKLPHILPLHMSSGRLYSY